MNTIMYDLPTVANSEQEPFLEFQQRGNTCWYYTAKMLLRFHKMATTSQDIHYEQLKSLHKVRQISTAISKRQYAKDVKKSVVRDLGLAHDDIKRQMKEFEHEVMKSQNPELQEVMKPDIKSLRLASNEERLRIAIDVVTQCGELADHSVDRAEMLDRFFKGEVFKILETPPKTVEEVLKILLKFGPVYGRGNLLDWKAGVETELVPPMASGKRTKQQEVPDYRSGAHAVAICGAVVNSNRIYYVDPNCTNVLRYADASVMLKNMFPTTSGKQFVLMYVACPAQSKKERCCLHGDDGVLE